jgi:hypothetical protein
MSQGNGGGGGGGYGPPPGGGGYAPPPGGGGYGPPQGGPPQGGGYGPPQGGGYGPPQGGPPQGGGYGPPPAPGGYGPQGQTPNAIVHQGTGTLALDVDFFPLLWMLFFTSPKITINGAMERRPWGKSQIPMPAGVYQLTIAFPYGLMGNAGQATLPQVQIMPGCVTQVTYRAPWIIFLSGSIFQAPPRPADAMSPYGR